MRFKCVTPVQLAYSNLNPTEVLSQSNMFNLLCCSSE